MHKEHHTPGTDIDGGIQVMHHDNPAHPELSIKEGYEVSDMNTRIIVISLIGLLVLMWGACVVIVMVIRGFNESRGPLDATAASVLATPGVQIPEAPHLQGTNAIQDRIDIDKANQLNVTSYGIVSQEPGMERVRIPVDRAMTLLAEGKAPYRQPAPEPAAGAAPVDPFAEPAAPASAAQEPADPFADPAPAPVPAEAPAQP